MSKTWNEAVRQIANEIVALLVKKQADYGHENINSFGEFGILVRANDKLCRLRNLLGKEPANEAIDDSWRDLAGYSMLALMLRNNQFNLPLEKGERND